VRIVENMVSSRKLKECSSVKNVEHADSEACDHDWEKIGRFLLVSLEDQNELGFSFRGKKECLDHRQNHWCPEHIYLAQCKKCGILTIQWDPWREIIEGKDNE